MKLKLLSIAILSTMILTACGGGSSSNDSSSGNSSENTSAEQQWIQLDYDENFETLDKDINTIKDSKLYTKEIYQSNIQNLNTSLYVTENGIYDESNAPIDPQYGKLIGNLQLKTNQWDLTPYSSYGSKDLIISSKHKTIDLSGKLILQYLSPIEYAAIFKNTVADYSGVKSNLELYKTLATERFPSGSTCLQQREISTNQDHLELYADLKNSTEQLKIANNFEFYKNDKESLLVPKMKDTTAYVVKTNDFELENTYEGAALYKGQYYHADFYPKSTLFEFNKYSQYLLNTLDTEDAKQVFSSGVQNICTFYNPKAAETIENLIKL